MEMKCFFDEHITKVKKYDLFLSMNFKSRFTMLNVFIIVEINFTECLLNISDKIQHSHKRYLTDNHHSL